MQSEEIDYTFRAINTEARETVALPSRLPTHMSVIILAILPGL